MHRALVLSVLAALTAGCSTLLTPEPTPVPGAAATLTRSIRTPIPTPERSGSPSPSVSPAPARPNPGASPSPVRAGPTEDDAARLQRRIEQALADPRLLGVEDLLLDHVALSTPQGGSALDNAQAATWLRDRATTGLKVNRVESGTQSVMLQVLTEGWPSRDPINQGRVSFTLRRYDSSGKPDEEHGDWKIDVIEAE